MSVRPLLMKSREKLTHYVSDTVATHILALYNTHVATDTDCFAQNGGTHGGVFATFLNVDIFTTWSRN